MLPTFVIGLREGVEASLIVGIVAAFLRQQGRRDALRWMWAGVAVAVVLCIGVAVALQVLDDELPQQQQEGLETVVAAVAVGMVTFMIVWMRRHARNLAGELRAHAAGALASGSAWALVAMAFFAVIREGLETAVFLLAAFQASGDALAAGAGAVLGILVAVAHRLGHLPRRRPPEPRTLLPRHLRRARARRRRARDVGDPHRPRGDLAEQPPGQALDLSWLVRPGTVSSSLLTGVLGLQPQPTVGEAAGWLLYAIPMLAFVLLARRPQARCGGDAVSSDLHRRVDVEQDRGGSVAAVLVAVPPRRSSPAAATTEQAESGSGATDAEGHADRRGLHAREAPGEDRARSRFEVSNGGTSKVSELELKNADGIILGERENIVGGISGSFTLDLAAGHVHAQLPERRHGGQRRRSSSPATASSTGDERRSARS